LRGRAVNGRGRSGCRAAEELLCPWLAAGSAPRPAGPGALPFLSCSSPAAFGGTWPSCTAYCIALRAAMKGSITGPQSRFGGCDSCTPAATSQCTWRGRRLVCADKPFQCSAHPRMPRTRFFVRGRPWHMLTPHPCLPAACCSPIAHRLPRCQRLPGAGGGGGGRWQMAGGLGCWARPHAAAYPLGPSWNGGCPSRFRRRLACRMWLASVRHPMRQASDAPPPIRMVMVMVRTRPGCSEGPLSWPQQP
jgi:hypothetical protein